MPDPKETKPQDNTMTAGDLPANAKAEASDASARRERARLESERSRDRREERMAGEALGASARSMPVEAPAERDAADVRAFFTGLNPEQIFARLPHWLQTNAIRGAMPEILTAVATEITEAEKATAFGEAPRAYKTVDRGGNVRDIVPGREPRGRGGRLPEPLPTTAALTPKAPPFSASPPAPVAPNGETKFAPSSRGAR